MQQLDISPILVTSASGKSQISLMAAGVLPTFQLEGVVIWWIFRERKTSNSRNYVDFTKFWIFYQNAKNFFHGVSWLDLQICTVWIVKIMPLRYYVKSMLLSRKYHNLHTLEYDFGGLLKFFTPENILFEIQIWTDTEPIIDWFLRL